MKRDYGNDDFYTNCYFQCEKAVITGNMLQPAYVLKIFEKGKASTKMHDKYGHMILPDELYLKGKYIVKTRCKKYTKKIQDT